MNTPEQQAIDSASDERIVNNANNTMRHSYRVLTDEEKLQMHAIKDLGLQFYKNLEVLGSSRELSLAKTKIEEAVMWGVKHVTG